MTLRRNALLALVLLAYAVCALRSPHVALYAVQAASGMLRDVGFLVLAVYFFLGLFEEWISPARLSRVIGRRAGSLQALGVAFAFGAWGTGPVYVTYPIASLFLRSGARVATAVTFMSAWQVVKITMLPFEMQFLGTRFALARLAACVLLPIPVGLLTEAVMRATRAAPRVAAPSADTEDALRDLARRVD